MQKKYKNLNPHFAHIQDNLKRLIKIIKRHIRFNRFKLKREMSVFP